MINIENNKAVTIDSCKYCDCHLSVAPDSYMGYANQGKYHILNLNAEAVFSFPFEFTAVPERCVSWSPSNKFMAISDGDKIYLADIEKKKVDFIANGSGPRFISPKEFVFFKTSKEKATFYLLNIQSSAIDKICSTYFFRDYDVTSDLSYLVRLGYSVSSVNIVLRDIEEGKDILLPKPPCRKGKGGAIFFDNYNRQD